MASEFAGLMLLNTNDGSWKALQREETLGLLSFLQSGSVDHPLPGSSLSTDFGSWQMVTGCGSIQERAVLHTDSSLPFSFPDELPNSCLLAALNNRESRLQEVRSAFLAAYSSTVGLRAAAPSPSGAIGGLLEQFARGVGLRSASSTL